MLAPGFPAGAGFDGNHDNAVDQRFGFFGGAGGFLVVHFADGVSAVGDEHDHLASLTAIESARG